MALLVWLIKSYKRLWVLVDVKACKLFVNVNKSEVYHCNSRTLVRRHAVFPTRHALQIPLRELAAIGICAKGYAP